MGKRNGLIAVVLASCVGGTAVAQQADQGDPPQPQQQAQPQQPSDSGTQTEPAQPAMQDQSKQPQTSARLSEIESDGVRLSQLDHEQISELQRGLQEAGYYMAEIDGIVGPQTRRALRQFYSDQARLASRGMILPQGAAALGLDQAEVEHVRGEDKGQAEEPERMPGTTEETPPEETMPEERTPEPSSPTPSPGAPEVNPHGTDGTGTGIDPGTAPLR